MTVYIGCGCCGKVICEDYECPGCIRSRREEREAARTVAPADRGGHTETESED